MLHYSLCGGSLSTVYSNIKISCKRFIVLLQRHKDHEVLLINAFHGHFGGTWLCLMLHFTSWSAFISITTQSLILLLNYSNVSDFAVIYSYLHLWPFPPQKKSFLELKKSDFSLQIWEISWIQTRGKQCLKDMQRFSTYCPSPAARGHKWLGSEKGTRSFPATECKLPQTIKYNSLHLLASFTYYLMNFTVSVKPWKE